jgi:hypothetical protein
MTIQMAILMACHAAFKARPDVHVEDIDEDSFTVTLMDESVYTIILDEADVEEDEEGDGCLLSPDKHEKSRFDAEQFSLYDHTNVLDVCLAAMAHNAEIRAAVSDLTTDGDGWNCEAIFKLAETDESDEGYYALKVG